MNYKSVLSCIAILTVCGLAGCSSAPSPKESKKAAASDKIQGKAEIVVAESTATDTAMSAGGPAVYLFDGVRRYRLFFKSPYKVQPGEVYVAEGVYAQRAIDEIGDPDQGKNGYPVQASCDRIVRTAWPGEAFDVTDGQATVLQARIRRYPARAVFLVTRIEPATSKDGGAAVARKDAESDDEDIPEISVPADKQRASLIEGPLVQPAPLWASAGGTVRCKVIIGKDGRIAGLEKGAQLCETVPWHLFRYQPAVKAGHPVKVKTEVEVRFEPRK